MLVIKLHFFWGDPINVTAKTKTMLHMLQASINIADRSRRPRCMVMCPCLDSFGHQHLCKDISDLRAINTLDAQRSHLFHGHVRHCERKLTALKGSFQARGEQEALLVVRVWNIQAVLTLLSVGGTGF